MGSVWKKIARFQVDRANNKDRQFHVSSSKRSRFLFVQLIFNCNWQLLAKVWFGVGRKWKLLEQKALIYYFKSCSYNSSVSFHQTHNSKTVKAKTDSSSFHAIQPALKWLDEALGMARCSFCRGSGNKIWFEHGCMLGLLSGEKPNLELFFLRCKLLSGNMATSYDEFSWIPDCLLPPVRLWQGLPKKIVLHMMCPVLIKFKWSNVKCWTCNATSIIHNGQVFCFGPRCFQNLFQRSSMAVMSFGWFLNFFTLPDVSARICKDCTGHLTNQVNLWFDNDDMKHRDDTLLVQWSID